MKKERRSVARLARGKEEREKKCCTDREEKKKEERKCGKVSEENKERNGTRQHN